MANLQQAVDMLNEMGISLDSLKIGKQDLQALIQKAVEAKMKDFQKHGTKHGDGNPNPLSVQDSTGAPTNPELKHFNLSQSFKGRIDHA